jgi:hypothetical protein
MLTRSGVTGGSFVVTTPYQQFAAAVPATTTTAIGPEGELRASASANNSGFSSPREVEDQLILAGSSTSNSLGCPSECGRKGCRNGDKHSKSTEKKARDVALHHDLHLLSHKQSGAYVIVLKNSHGMEPPAALRS